MSRLPRQDVPVGLQRYQPGHLPNRRERTVVGRSNRLQFTAQTHRAMEQQFLPSAASADGERQREAQLTVGQGFALSGYRSGRGQAAEANATRTLVQTLRSGEAVVGEDGTASSKSRAVTKASTRGIQPPTSAPPSPPEAQLEAEQAWLDVETHPTVAAMVCENRYGAGHTITPENFFLRGGGQDADYYTGLPMQQGTDAQRYATFKSLPFTRNRDVPARSEGGGTLEYADPVTDEYARNPVVARFDNRQLKAATAATCTASASASAAGAGVNAPETSTAPVDADAAEVPACEKAVPLSSTSPAVSTVSPAKASSAAAVAPRLPCHDAWLAQYVPSARPYDVQPFLGRCGYSDVRLTYHRVQPQAGSDMYASSRDYQSTYTVPLATPNQWQLRDARLRKSAM